MTHPMEKESTGTKSQLFISILNNAVLMMGTHATEGNCLPFFVDVFVKSFVAESTIVRVIMLCYPSHLLQQLLICSFGK